MYACTVRMALEHMCIYTNIQAQIHYIHKYMQQRIDHSTKLRFIYNSYMYTCIHTLL